MDDPRSWATWMALASATSSSAAWPARLGVARQAIFQGSPLEQLQGHERHPVGLADLVDLHDVGMPEPGDRLGLDAEPGQVVGTGPVPADHLQGDQPVQAALAGLVDDAHAPFANQVHDLVGGDPGPAFRAIPARFVLGGAGRETSCCFAGFRRPLVDGQGLRGIGGIGSMVLARRHRTIIGAVAGRFPESLTTQEGKPVDMAPGQLFQRLLAAETVVDVSPNIGAASRPRWLLQKALEVLRGRTRCASHGRESLV